MRVKMRKRHASSSRENGRMQLPYLLYIAQIQHTDIVIPISKSIDKYLYHQGRAGTSFHLHISPHQAAYGCKDANQFLKGKFTACP